MKIYATSSPQEKDFWFKTKASPTQFLTTFRAMLRMDILFPHTAQFRRRKLLLEL